MGGYSGGGALGGLLQGMVAGRQLRQQMQQHLLQQHQMQQEMTARDIQNRMLLRDYARPVSDMGTVSDSTVVPTPQGGTPAGDAPTAGAGLPASVSAALPAGPSNPISYQRPADKSRTREYGGQSYEFLTPEELAARQVSRTRAMQEGTGVRIDPTDASRQFGVNAPFYEDPSHIGQYLSSARWGQTIDPRLFGGGQPAPSPQAQAEGAVLPPPTFDSQGTMSDMLGGPPAPPKIPLAALPSFTRIRTNAATNQTRLQTNQNTNDTRRDVTRQTNQTRAEIATNAEAGRNTRATDANSTRTDIATNAEAGRNQRANNRLNAPPKPPNGIDLARINAIQKEEQGYHNTRNDIGNLLTSGKDEKGTALTPASREALQRKLTDATNSLQGAQFRKARLMKAQQPPDAATQKLGEGDVLNGPDGHSWTKKGGVLYIVK